MLQKLRIIFMGTPNFAVPSLRILSENGFDIVAVVTVPDKPAGRGLQIQMSPVKAYALSRNIPVLQPDKLKSPEFLDALKSYNANLQVVVAFRMLPEPVWNMPEIGTFNLHASLLPDYRGAAPINRAIMNGETETGATTFFLKHEIDTGDIIYQERTPIGPDEDAGSLHDRLMELGAGLVLKTVQGIERDEIKTLPQVIKGEPKSAPKIFKEDCKINWETQTLDQLHNFVRGLSPYPAAWTILDSKILKIYKTEKEPIQAFSEMPGTINTDGKNYLKISCKGGYLLIKELQIEGKKKMGIAEFLRGFVLRSAQLTN